MPSPTGKCRGCGKRLTKENAVPDRAYASGFRNHCTACRNATRRRSREAIKSKSPHKDSDNSTTVEVVSYEQPRSLEELLRLYDVDSAIWQVERWKANTWTLADGTPASQITAWLERILRVQTEIPPIQPISIQINPHKQPKRPATSVRKALVIPDSQNGYQRDLRTGVYDPIHDRRCWAIAVELARSGDFDDIVLLGDMLDCTEFTDKFVVEPRFYQTFQPALVELSWWLGQLRLAAPATRIVYIEGNHEARIPRLLSRNLAAAFDLRSPVSDHPVLSVPHLLGLEALKVGYIGDYPNGELWLNENLRCIHGTTARPKPMESVGSTLRQTRSSFIMGHIHRIEQAHQTLYHHDGPVVYCGYSPGTFARLDGSVPGAKTKTNWQNGLAVVDYEPGNGGFLVSLHPIYNGEMLWQGRRLQGDPDMKSLRNDTGWEAL